MLSYEFDIGSLLRAARLHFFEINYDKDLTEADKEQLKRFYLEHMVAPRARKILEKHLAHEMQKERVHHRMTPADRRRREAMRSASPDRPPDR